MENRNFDQLCDKVIAFRDSRNWKHEHTPENLAISISIEASELLLNFQWQEEAKDLANVREEAADVMIYLICLARALDFDLLEAVEEKMKKNGERYPPAK